MLNRVTELANNPSSLYVAIAVVALSILYYVISNLGLPPGPVGLPYIGYWPFLSHTNSHVELHELAQKYGDVFSFRITGRTFIHFGSYKAIKEAHITKSDCFNERMTGFNILYSYLEGGLIFTDVDRWKIMRKFFYQQFREFGMNVIRESQSDALYDTVKETVAELKMLKGEPVDIGELLAAKSSKIMRVTLLGKDGLTEEELREFNANYLIVLMSLTSKNGMLMGEFARYFIIPFCQGYSKGKKAHKKMENLVYNIIGKRKATYNENHIRDVVDAYYKERDDRKSKNDLTYKYFTDKFLVTTLLQILGDGVLFLGLLVADFIKALVNHPEEQDKLHQELLEVCGLHRDPEMEDKNKLSYTNAFILEVMRTTELMTMFPSLECTKETTLSGYRIPKGAITVYNFYSAHMNPNDYEEPEKFNPSRFVSEKDKRPDFLSIFGIGRRSCMGEGFAMNQVFLFLTTLVKHFRFSMPPGAKDTRNLYFSADKVYVQAEERCHK